MRRSKYSGEPSILREILANTGRFIGWNIVLVVSFILGSAVAFIPLSYLPGTIETEFVNMRWVPYILMPALWIGIFTWRCQHLERLRGRQSRLSFKLAMRWIWAIISSFTISFWPLGFAAWLNAYDVEDYSIHEMKVVGVTSPSPTDAGTETTTYLLRDAATGWETELQFTEVWKGFVMMGSCVQVIVRHGRLGLDWIDDVQPCQWSDVPAPAPASSP